MSSDTEFIRLLTPAEDGEPVFKKNLGPYDINENYDDLCLIEVPSDEPNIEWLLQDPGTVRVGYSQSIKDRDSCPTDIMDSGWNGPILTEDDRGLGSGKRSGRIEFDPPDEESTDYKSLVDPEEADKYAIKMKILSREQINLSNSENIYFEYIEKDLSNQYDISNPIQTTVNGSFVGDGVPLRIIKYIIFPNAEAAVIIRSNVNDEFTNTKMRVGIQDAWREDMLSYDVKDVFIFCPPNVIEKSMASDYVPYKYVHDDSLPTHERNGTILKWHKREKPLYEY